MKILLVTLVTFAFTVVVYTQVPKDTFRIIEIRSDSSDASIRNLLFQHTQNQLAKLDRVAFVDEGKGDWAISLNAEPVGNDLYAMTWSIGQQAKCTFSPQLTKYTSPPFNCMSVLSFNTIALVTLPEIRAKINLMVSYFDKQTRLNAPH